MLSIQRDGQRIAAALVNTRSEREERPMELNKMIHIERLQRGGASETEIVRAVEESDEHREKQEPFWALRRRDR
jgi:hypothetical protein